MQKVKLKNECSKEEVIETDATAAEMDTKNPLRAMLDLYYLYALLDQTCNMSMSQNREAVHHFLVCVCGHANLRTHYRISSTMLRSWQLRMCRYRATQIRVQFSFHFVHSAVTGFHPNAGPRLSCG